MLKMVEDNWTLPPLTNMDGQANSLMLTQNFTQAPLAPLVLPARQNCSDLRGTPTPTPIGGVTTTPTISPTATLPPTTTPTPEPSATPTSTSIPPSRSIYAPFVER